MTLRHYKSPSNSRKVLSSVDPTMMIPLRHLPKPWRLAPVILLLLVSFSLLQGAWSYSVGAPDMACTDMTPQHGQELQPAPAPYTLTPNATSIFGGDRIVLKLEANPDTYMEGFFLQARMTEDGKPEGIFFTGTHKTVLCGAGINNGVTHSNSDKLNTVTVEWEAPSDFEGDVFFRGTAVKSYTTYWTDLRSEKVTIKKRSVTEPPTTSKVENADAEEVTTTTSTTTTKAPLTGVASSISDLYGECGKAKSCYGAPNNCVEKKNCKYMVTYTDIGGGRYEFELQGTGGGDKYVAVALSEDMEMGDDSVVLCTSKDGETDAYMTWNEGKNNIDVTYPKRGLRVLESGDMDGKLYCRFQRDEMTRPKDNKEFDLKGDRFHVMVSEGPMTRDNRPQYHSNNRIVSARLVTLGETSNLKGSASEDSHLHKMIHGCLMIGAWVCAASCGILFARYYKQTWVNYKLCNIDQWFHNHRFFMILTWGLTMASLILIVYEEKKYEAHNHAIVGTTSIVLCFIQPFMALARPHPGTKNRSIFNCLHWFVGNSAQILGIAAIFLGYEKFFGQGRHWVKEVSWYTLIAFIAFHILVHLFLSISQCIGDRRPKNSEVFPLKEFAGSRTLLQPEDIAMDAPNACFRKVMLGLYLPINWLFTALLILLVVFDKDDMEKQFTEWGLPPFWNDL